MSLAACGKKDNSASGTASGGKTTIVVDCPPLKTDNDGKSLAQWNADVAAFEKTHPDIVIKSISVGSQCDNPPDFTARLQGGTEADVFYGYMTDLNQVLDAGQAEDITSYVNSSTVPYWDSLIPSAKAVFTDQGKLYALPFSAYTMGLVVNKVLFQQAGLDPTKPPPTTWQEVAADAKKIAALDNGIAGYSDYSAGNTGGWHFTAELYSRGGQMVSDDGKSAAFVQAMTVPVRPVPRRRRPRRGARSGPAGRRRQSGRRRGGRCAGCRSRAGQSSPTSTPAATVLGPGTGRGPSRAGAGRVAGPGKARTRAAHRRAAVRGTPAPGPRCCRAARSPRTATGPSRHRAALSARR